MIMNEATQWLESAEQAGLQISESARGKIEVSFLLSYSGEGLDYLAGAGLEGEGGYINHEGEYCS